MSLFDFIIEVTEKLIMNSFLYKNVIQRVAHLLKGMRAHSTFRAIQRKPRPSFLTLTMSSHRLISKSFRLFHYIICFVVYLFIEANLIQAIRSINN